MEVDRNQLLTILQAAKPGLAKKEIMEQAVHFIFTGEDLVTFNDQICIMHPFKTDVPFSVRGEEFYKILKGISEDKFELTYVDDRLKIISESTTAQISALVGEDGKVEEHIESLRQHFVDWKSIPENFTRGISLCSFSASKDMTQGALTGIFINDKDILSTDKLRGSWFTLKESMPEVVLAAVDMMELAKFPITSYTISDNWAHFATDDEVVFNCRRVLGKLPNVKKLFDGEVLAKITLPDELKTIIESVTFLAEGNFDSNKTVECKITKERIYIKAEKDIGWIEKKIRLEKPHKGKELEFTINPVFLAQVLDKSADMYVLSNRVIFTSEDFKHIMALPMDK